ncbi:MAG: hypothetical protein U0Q19_01455 [Kineosporiaceae bacterium]
MLAQLYGAVGHRKDVFRMTAIDHSQMHALSVSGLEPDFARRDTSHPEHAELHLIRLALDLQVDALLLALGASVRDHSSQVPWQRWLTEDLELAQVLTSALVESEVGPSPTIGSAVSGPTGNVLDHLLARYSSMEELLNGALHRPHTGQSWRMAASHALIRCRTRMEEIHVHQRAQHARVAAERAASAEVTAHARQREAFLPGEWLG